MSEVTKTTTTITDTMIKGDYNQQQQQSVNNTTTSTTETTKTTTTTKSNSKDNNKMVEVSLYWDEWSRCTSTRYQRDLLYREGRLDSCTREWKDLKIALKAKFIEYKDPIQAQNLINTTYYKKRTTISPTAGVVWDLKDNPNWD